MMLDSVRAYASEKLDAFPDAGASVRQRHAEHFVRFAREHVAQVRTPGEAVALRKFAADADNARNAMHEALRAQQHEIGAELALALGISLQRGGFLREAMRHIETGLEAAGHLEEKEALLRAHLLRELAGLYWDQFAWAAARRCAGEALALFEQWVDRRGQAEAANLLGL